VRPALCRPQGSSIANERIIDAAIAGMWKGLGVEPVREPEQSQHKDHVLRRHVFVVDSILCGRNAAHVRPLDVEDIDSDDDDTATHRGSVVPQQSVRQQQRIVHPSAALADVLASVPPQLQELVCDNACAAVGGTSSRQYSKATTVLHKAVRRARAAGAPISAELASKHPRGLCRC